MKITYPEYPIDCLNEVENWVQGISVFPVLLSLPVFFCHSYFL